MKRGSISFSEWCKREKKLLLLCLYDVVKNDLPPSEVPYSAAKEYHFRCPSCGITWMESLNRLNHLKLGHYNVIKQRNEETFCPYCKGERPSPYYNLTTAMPEVTDWWDRDRNSKPPDMFTPSTHQKFYLVCPECGYALPHPVRISYRRGLHCPRCGDGKNQEVTFFNCLNTCFPEISRELDDGRNKGITGEMILSTCKEKLWFVCSKGHRYQARVSNRTHLGRGCPICYEQNRTSFVKNTHNLLHF